MQDVFCFAALVNTITGTIYTNITGAFPVRSFKSMQYIFVVYVYDLNAIIVCAMPSCTDASMVTAFREVITTLKTGGYHPAPNVMDNECVWLRLENTPGLNRSTSNLSPRTTIESTLQKGSSQHSKCISLRLLQLWTCTALSNHGMNFSRKLNSP